MLGPPLLLLCSRWSPPLPLPPPLLRPAVLAAWWVLPPGRIEATRREIFASYLRTSFAEDILSYPPWDTVAHICGSRDVRLQFALASLRVLRFRLIMRAFRVVEEDVRFSYVLVRMSKFVTMLTVHVHLFACIFWFVAKYSEDQQASWPHRFAVDKLGDVPNTFTSQYLISLCARAPAPAARRPGRPPACCLPPRLPPWCPRVRR